MTVVLASLPSHTFFLEMCVCEKYGNEGKLEEGNREKTKMAKI